MTQNNLPQSNAQQVKTIEDKYDFARKEKFLQYINTSPNETEVKTNKFAGNSKYLPISFIEMTLDEIFFMEWTTENFQYQVVANELIGSIDLVFTHPVSGKLIRRTGAAAVPIQMKSGSNVTDIGSKIKNTLVKDFPHLKASCLANAARSIGKRFGRDLNRKDNDTYQPTFLPSVQQEQLSISEKINGVESMEVLEIIFQENQNAILKDTAMVALYKNKKNELNAA